MWPAIAKWLRALDLHSTPSTANSVGWTMASERCLSLASLDIFAVDATIVSIEQLAREEQPVEFFHYDY